MRAAFLALLALAAVVLPPAAAVPEIRHVGATLLERGCEGTEYCIALDPPTPTFTYGERVAFVVMSPDSNRAEHNLQFASFGIRSDVVAPGAGTEVAITLNQGGTFAIYSGVGRDRARGMESEITVVDPTVDATRVELPSPGAAAGLAALALAALALAAAARRGAFDR